MLKANIPMLMLQFILSENSSGHRTVDRVVRGRIHFPGVHIVLSHDKSRDMTLIFLSGVINLYPTVPTFHFFLGC